MIEREKGQVFSSDFLVGIVVLLFILTALQVYQSNMLQNIEYQNKLLYRESLVSRTDTLLLSEGLPSDWNSSSVEVLGLSTGEPNHINETKLARFVSLPAENVTEFLGLRGRNFYFSVENTTDVISHRGISYSFGNKTWNESKNIYTVKRKVFLEDSKQTAVMRLVVW